MVKLIRLTTENDNNFNCNMDSDIVVGEGAQIALQNLTFQTIFNGLDIGANQGVISFNIDRDVYTPANSRTIGTLEPKIYDSENYETFFPAMENALNDTLTLNSGYAGVGVAPTKYETTGQYHVGGVNEDDVVSPADKKSIFFRLSPIIHPQVIGEIGRLFNPQEPDPADPNSQYPKYNGLDSLFAINEDEDGAPMLELMGGGDGAQDILTYGGYTKTGGIASSADLDSVLYPVSENVSWCKGSSIFWARVGSLSTVITAKGAEGFAIGLSKTALGSLAVAGTVLEQTERDFEIRCYRRTDNYQFIIPGMANTPADSVPPVAPNSADITGAGSGNINNNDIIMIEKSGVNIIGSVITSAGGGTKNTLFTYEIPIADRGKNLYPYMYICGAQGAASGQFFEGTMVNWVGLTVDPYEVEELEDEPDFKSSLYDQHLAPQYGNQWGNKVDGRVTALDYSAADIKDKAPQFDEAFYYPRVFEPGNLDPVLTIDKEILRFMGFSRPQFNGTGTIDLIPTYGFSFGFMFIPTSDFQVTTSDNYVVVLDSQPVLSYDGSLTQGREINNPVAAKTGKRMNIIATIPDNDNESGLVEFNAREIVYIDLDNSFKQNISNLRLRVLTKQLQPLNTSGISVMTLLLKDTKKE